ncbi:MAG: type IV toxin-antitoxin system AbiEi family antitoxin [Prevotella sp.]|nr:type IV toxin-antitoxin system AbiEi family antitoxin [Prevotella sp.]
MSISTWIEKREIRGFPTFSYQDVREAFSALSPIVVSNELHRLCKRKRIQSVHRGFYTVVPIQFKDRGIVPPYNYINQLMTHLHRHYYVCLLSAGVLHGAAHQRPQRLTIMTEFPKITFTTNKNEQLAWFYRKEIPQSLLCETNTDTSTILYSNAELTAVDLVQYSGLVGGLSIATTIVAELMEKFNFHLYGNELLNVTTLSTLQRLGYILDVVLENSQQADAIHEIIRPHLQNVRYRPLSTSLPIANKKRNTKWRIIVNQEIELDDIW